ncbi:hypothetical protein BCR44DRAFT_1436503, partial [Catenaria anguillulae PL171]
MTTVDPQPNEHPAHASRQQDPKSSPCAALPSSPPSSPYPPSATSHHDDKDDGSQGGKHGKNVDERSAAVITTAATAESPNRVPATATAATATAVGVLGAVTQSRDWHGDHTCSSSVVCDLESCNARDPSKYANAPTAPNAIAFAEPARAHPVPARVPPKRSHVTKSVEAAPELPTPPGSAMPSPPLFVRGPSRLSAQREVTVEDGYDVRQECSGQVERGTEEADTASSVHDDAAGQLGGAASVVSQGQSLAEIEPWVAHQDQDTDLKSWSSPCADRFVAKPGRKLNRAVSWHDTVKTPARAPVPVLVAASSSAPLADQDPAPTAPPMYLELESTPLPRAKSLPLSPAPAAAAPLLLRSTLLKPSAKRKRSRSPSPDTLPQLSASSSASSRAPLAPTRRSHVQPGAWAPRRVHTLPAPPSALTVSPTKALEWWQWAEDKENIDPETWLRQYEAKKKQVRPADQDVQRHRQAGCGDGGLASSAATGGNGGGGAASGARSRNSAPSSSTSASKLSGPHTSTGAQTLSILACRSSNACLDTLANSAMKPPNKRQRTGYVTASA